MGIRGNAVGLPVKKDDDNYFQLTSRPTSAPAIAAAAAIAQVSRMVRNMGRSPRMARPIPSRMRSTAVPMMKTTFACSSGRKMKGMTGVMAAMKSAIPILSAWMTNEVFCASVSSSAATASSNF